MMNTDTSFLDCIEFGEWDDTHNFLKEREFLDFESVFHSMSGLLSPSKKISKQITNFFETNDEKPRCLKRNKEISRKNGVKLAPFFRKWKELRKKDKSFKKQIKHWFSSFDAKANKTYIYRDLSETVRIHFRLAVRNGFAFKRMEDSKWQTLFVKITDFLTDEIQKMAPELEQAKKCKVYPLWIESLESFRIDRCSSHLDDKDSDC